MHCAFWSWREERAYWVGERERERERRGVKTNLLNPFCFAAVVVAQPKEGRPSNRVSIGRGIKGPAVFNFGEREERERRERERERRRERGEREREKEICQLAVVATKL